VVVTLVDEVWAISGSSAVSVTVRGEGVLDRGRERVDLMTARVVEDKLAAMRANEGGKEERMSVTG